VNRWRAALVAVVFVAGLPCSLRAQEFHLDAFADMRVIKAPEERSWRDGGLGKFGTGNGDFVPMLSEISALGQAQLLPELSATAHARFAPDQRSVVDLVEAYLRYRPVSTTRLRWSFKAGAFFPPISLENDGIGWTALWTLTPSAINSWVGEELRTIGGETRVEWRGDGHQIEATAALFGVNDPTGILLAERGWAFGERPLGLFDRNRLPDVTLRPGQTAPIYSLPFQEIDGRVGWYTGLAWRATGYGKLALLYYDNAADGSASTGQYAWHTDFWSVGAETEIAPLVFKAQYMVGATEFAPVGLRSHTDFEAAYLLVGWELGERWRLAGRVDRFSTAGLAPRGLVDYSETGYAGTAALTWRPADWMRVTGELLQIDSTRRQRALAGISPHSSDTQVQLSVRLFY
jgi:hypothetical protein